MPVNSAVNRARLGGEGVGIMHVVQIDDAAGAHQRRRNTGTSKVAR